MRSSSFLKCLLALFLWIAMSSWIPRQPGGFVPGEGRYKTAVFDSSFEKALYKGSLDISKHHLSGLFYLKKVSDSSFRIIFSNEMGMTFFDLEIKSEKLIVHSCFPSLDRASLMKLLKRDFLLLLVPDTTVKKMKPGKPEDPESINYKVKSARGSFRYTYDKDSGKINRIRTSGAFIGKTDLRILRDMRQQPKKIDISNPTIGLHISMLFLGN
jgi:hypothetical protein